MRRRPALAVLGLLAGLAGGPVSAQPVSLVVEDLRPPPAPRVPLPAEHPWIPDVMSLVGLDGPGRPVRVLLVPESSALARSLPSWVAGFAEGTETVVLLPERTPVYPDGGLEEVLAHEVAHVLIDRAARGRPVPRWFHEGVAMVAGRSWGLKDRTQLALDLLVGERVPLHRLDAMFRGSDAEVRRAYALAGALVQELLERYGTGLPRALLSRMSGGERFDEAFRLVTGATLLDVDDIFLARQALFRRWLPVVTSGTALWFAITVMAVVAAWKRRRRSREQLARLAAEEEAAAAATREPPPMEAGGHDDWPVN